MTALNLLESLKKHVEGYESSNRNDFRLDILTQNPLRAFSLRQMVHIAAIQNG